MKAAARLLAGLAGVLVAAAPGQAAESTVTPIGRDGPASYYRVSCASGATASIEERLEPPTVCVTAAHLKERVCRPGWTVNAAADYACRTAPPKAR
jgi:hypothetical protein